MRWHRKLLWCCILLLTLLAGGLWYADAVWLPAQGKVWLCRLLAERLNAVVTVDELGFHPLEGFVLKELRVTAPATRRLLGRVTYAHGIVFPWALVEDRSLHFRAYLQVEDPGPMIVLASGTYGLRSGHLTMDVTTKPIAIEQLGANTRRWVPAAVRSGSAVVQVTVEQQASDILRLSGTCDLRQVVVEYPPYRAGGTVRIEGTAQYTKGAWHWQGLVSPRAATVTGPESWPPIKDVAGSLQVTDFDVTSLNLTGTTGAATLGLTGDIADVRRPRLHLTALAEGPVGAFRALVPAWPQDVQVNGQVHLSADLRGAPSSPTALRWTAQGQLTDGTLNTPQLPFPIEHLKVQARCDPAARQCTIDVASGVAGEASFNAAGTVGMADPFPSVLAVNVTTPLAQMIPWMPPTLKDWAWSGQGVIKATLRGPLREITPEAIRGELDIRDGGVQPPDQWPAVRRINGRLVYAEETLSTPGLRFSVNDVPYTLTGTVQHLAAGEEPEATLRLASEPLVANLDAQLEEQTLHLRLLEGRYRNSTFRVLGDLLNLPHPTANLYAESAIELSDLSTLPLPETWRTRLTAQRVQGLVRANASLQGPLDARWLTGRLGVKGAAERCTIGAVTLQQMNADVRIEEGQLDVPTFGAVYAGGQVQGRLTADLRQAHPPFQLQVAAIQVDLAQATQPWRSATAPPMAGALNTSWTLQGQGLQWTALRGTGTVQAVGENLGTVPVLDRILGGLGGVVADHLRLGRLRQVTFKQVEGRITIAGGKAMTQDVAIRGDTMGVLVEGAVGVPDGGLDLVALPSVAQAVVQESPVAGVAAAPAKSFDALALGRVRITGTLQEPRFTSQLAPVGDLLQRFLPSGVRDVLQGVQDILRR